MTTLGQLYASLGLQADNKLLGVRELLLDLDQKQWWRLFVDIERYAQSIGYSRTSGLLVNDPAAPVIPALDEHAWVSFEHNEAGSIEAFVSALNYALTIEGEITEDDFLKIHMLMTSNVVKLGNKRGVGSLMLSDDSSLVSQVSSFNPGEYRKKLVSFHLPCELFSQAGLADFFDRLRDNKISSYINSRVDPAKPENNLVCCGLAPDSSYIISEDGVTVSQEIDENFIPLISSRINTILAELNAFIAGGAAITSLEDDVKPFITGVVTLLKDIEFVHPFDDANLRTLVVLLDVILMRNHMPPTCLVNPHLLGALSPTEFADEVINGMKNFIRIKNTGRYFPQMSLHSESLIKEYTSLVLMRTFALIFDLNNLESSDAAMKLFDLCEKSGLLSQIQNENDKFVLSGIVKMAYEIPGPYYELLKKIEPLLGEQASQAASSSAQSAFFADRRANLLIMLRNYKKRPDCKIKSKLALIIKKINAGKYSQAFRTACVLSSAEIIPVVDLFLAYKHSLAIDINERPVKSGKTALHRAAEGNVELYNHLINRYGADDSIKDNEGKTPNDLYEECLQTNGTGSGAKIT